MEMITRVFARGSLSPLALPSPALEPGTIIAPQSVFRVSTSPQPMSLEPSFGHVKWSDPPKSWYDDRDEVDGIDKERGDIHISNLTGDKFVLGIPIDSLVCKRHIWNRATDYGRNVDPDGWQGSFENQYLFEGSVDMCRAYLEETGRERIRPDEYKTIDWNKPATRLYADVGPKTICFESHASDPKFDGTIGPELTETDMDRYELADEEDWAIDAFNDVASSYFSAYGTLCRSINASLEVLVPNHGQGPPQNLTEESTGEEDYDNNNNEEDYFSTDEDFTDDMENAVIQSATIAVTKSPHRPPQRSKALTHRMTLDTGLASRARRLLKRTGSECSPTASCSSEGLVATAQPVRLYQPPPAKLIVVRGRVVTQRQADAEAVDAPCGATSLRDHHEPPGVHRLWRSLKHKTSNLMTRKGKVSRGESSCLLRGSRSASTSGSSR